MDYQAPPLPKTVNIRYSSDFRQSGDKYFIAYEKASAKQSKATAQRDPARYPALGGIVLKKLPADWQPAKPDFQYKGTAKMFVPQNDDTCAVAMLHDVLRDKYRKVLQRLLTSPAKPTEGKDLEMLIGLIPDYTRKDEFQLTGARTKDVDGKRILVVEGKNTAIDREYYFVYSSQSAVGFETYTKIWYVAPLKAPA